MISRADLHLVREDPHPNHPRPGETPADLGIHRRAKTAKCRVQHSEKNLTISNRASPSSRHCFERRAVVDHPGKRTASNHQVVHTSRTGLGCCVREGIGDADSGIVECLGSGGCLRLSLERLF